MVEAPLLIDDIRLRSATPADLPSTTRLAELAFSARPGSGPEPGDRAAGPEGDDAREPPPPLRVVAERRGQVVAAAAAMVRGQWFGGRRTLCAAVGPVAVGVEARGLGVGKALMTELLRVAHTAGATTSALIPSTHRFYRGLGYGIAGRRPVFALSTSELRSMAAPRVAGLALRPTRGDDADAVARLVSERAARGTALLDHGGADERAVEDPTGGDSYVAEVHGVVRGWCLMGRKDPSTRYANYEVVVHDIVADDPGVELALWQLLVADHPSALRAEALMLPGSLVEHRLERQQEVLDDASWMARLLDVDAAITSRGYAEALSAEFVLHVDDPICPWNTGTRAVNVGGGSAQVRPVPQATPDVVIGPAELASLFTGYLDPVQARHQGRLEVGDDVAATLRALFAGPPAWLARPF